MNHLKILFLGAIFLFATSQGNAQTTDTLSNLLNENEKPTIELNPNAVDKKDFKKKKKVKKEKKRKKNEFWGVFSKRIVLKKTKGRSVIVEKFYVLPSYEAPSKYVWDKFYFDPKNTKRRDIVKTNYISPQYGLPLHGSYEKRVNGEIVESGYYYKGTKHGRWVTYGRDNVLTKKEKWYKGYPKDSNIFYYDSKRTKVKEVVPIIYGQQEGLYMSFYASGRIKEMGHYQNGKKVGRWTEFKDVAHKANRKRITDYPRYYWLEEDPVIVNEW